MKAQKSLDAADQAAGNDLQRHAPAGLFGELEHASELLHQTRAEPGVGLRGEQRRQLGLNGGIGTVSTSHSGNRCMPSSDLRRLVDPEVGGQRLGRLERVQQEVADELAGDHAGGVGRVLDEHGATRTPLVEIGGVEDLRLERLEAARPQVGKAARHVPAGEPVAEARDEIRR